MPPKGAILSARDREELRQRVGEARARTKELVDRYLASSARLTVALARYRESASVREETRAALRDTVAQYAHLLRALGEPPERTLVLIKTAFGEAALHQSDESRAALDEVVKWIVDAYFAA
ncbi:MAG TPA: hypothetical protein VGH98_13180 [Gemmatimonadaceae bacterium]